MEFVKGEFVLYRPEDVILLKDFINDKTKTEWVICFPLLQDETIPKDSQYRLGVIVGKEMTYKDKSVRIIFPITEISVMDFKDKHYMIIKDILNGIAFIPQFRFVETDKIVKVGYANENILNDYSDLCCSLSHEYNALNEKYQSKYKELAKTILDVVSKVDCYPSNKTLSDLKYYSKSA